VWSSDTWNHLGGGGEDCVNLRKTELLRVAKVFNIVRYSVKLQQEMRKDVWTLVLKTST
jgi:hypothetical protein